MLEVIEDVPRSLESPVRDFVRASAGLKLTRGMRRERELTVVCALKFDTPQPKRLALWMANTKKNRAKKKRNGRGNRLVPVAALEAGRGRANRKTKEK